jgi:putative heme-binding domain-containing protein
LSWFAPTLAAQDLAFRPGDRLVLVGNALAERAGHDGWLESELVCAFPESDVSLRNLGFAGDEFDVRARTDGFGSPAEWLDRTRADVVWTFFGYGESFRSDAELAHLSRDFARWLESLAPRRVVVFSAIPREAKKGRLLSEPGPFNARLERVNSAMAEAARERGLPFVDLYTPMAALFAQRESPWTVDGVHLTSEGNRALAEILLRGLFGPRYLPGDAARRERVRALAQAKSDHWFQRYQASDGYNVYGGRSGLRYTDRIADVGGGQDFEQGLSNFEVLQRELEQLDALCAHLDEAIRLGSRGQFPRLEPPALPPAIPVSTNRAGPHPFLDPEAAIGRMSVPEGLQVCLFASERQFPELANPVQMSFDARGRLWVAAWPSYPHPTPRDLEPDRLLIFEDSDRDGRADSVVVFAEGLVNPTGFEFWNGGVLLAGCPDLWFLKDVDGDDRCDVRERVLQGLSSADTHHSANSFVLGPEGGLYFQEGVFHRSQVESVHGVIRGRDAAVWRFDPRSFRVERYVAYPFANPHGHVFDRWGVDFVTDGTGNLNFDALPISGELTPPAQHPSFATLFAQRSRPAAATEILSSAHFPPEYQGHYLIANVIGFQGIFRYALERDGSSFRGREEPPLLFSSDPNFRPVDLEVGPDGALWLLDWQAPLIGHMQHHLRDPSRDHAHGRVYRVVCPDRPLLSPPVIAGASIAELLESLKDPSDRLRYRARIELSGRDSGEVVAAARAWSRAQDQVHARLEGLWVQAHHGVLDGELLRELLGSSEPSARAAAVRVLRHLRHGEERVEALLGQAVGDEDPRVRLEAVVALAHFASASAAETALRVLDRPRDPALDYALGETLRQLGPHWRSLLLSGRPFASGHPRGLAHAVSLLTDVELAAAADGPAVWRERLARASTPADSALTALRALAQESGDGLAAEWAAAVQRADQLGGPSAEGVLKRLFELPSTGAFQPAAGALERLARTASRAVTRRQALALRLEDDSQVDACWSEHSAKAAALAELLEAGIVCRNVRTRELLLERATAYLENWRAGEDVSGTPARYVRVELPGPARTLTLAEVEVEGAGTNLARQGRASQSSVAWGGVPGRALDGNASGAFEDGGQTHTREGETDPWWEVDLGREHALDGIRIHNRTDGEFGARLDGYVVRALDEMRRETYCARGYQAPSRIELDLRAPSVQAAQAAVRFLASAGRNSASVLELLAARFDQPPLRIALTGALREIGPGPFRAELRSALAEQLLDLLQAPETSRSEELWALAEAWAPHAGGPAALELLSLCQRARPLTVLLRPVPERMEYDRREIAVLAGRPIRLTFENVDLMPHNFVLAAVGALAQVGLAAEAMAADPQASERHFVPDLPQVLLATRLLQPGQSQTLEFAAPEEPGDYPYVCTFPGHWTRMNGLLRVAATPAELAELAELAERAPAREREAPAAAARGFVRDWQLADLDADLARLRSASAERGRDVAEQASCLRCHASPEALAMAEAHAAHGHAAAVPRVGPTLAEAVAAHADARQVLRQILEPSAHIRPGYESLLFLTHDGRAIAGRLMAQAGDVLLVMDDPYRDDLLELPLAELAERRPQSLSTMPSGLLSTFRRDEILDLLAYLEALRP